MGRRTHRRSLEILDVRDLLIIALATLMPAAGQATEPAVQDKSKAPADLQAVFAVQDDTESRRSSTELELTRRTLTPSSGIEQSLLAKNVGEQHPALVIMAMEHFPSSAEWRAWAERGLTYIQYLGQEHWLVQLTGDVRTAYAMTGASAFIEYLPSDKVDPRLDEFQAHQSFFDPERHLVVLDITFVPEVSPETVDRLKKQLHQDGVAYLDASSGPRELTLVTDPANLDRLQMMHEIFDIRPGAWQIQPLMDGVRATARAEHVVGGDGELLTGKHIRAATRERIGPLQDLDGLHEAFREPGPGGQAGAPRLSANALATDCWQGLSIKHGMMTAGVLLGNGRLSERYNGGELGYRGIAPEATYECYFHAGSHAHLSSHSYLPAPGNGTVVGQSSEERHHAHIAALGNSGQGGPHGCGAGYYSVCNPQKNLLGVANAQVNGEIYAGSSAGPTDDGRIKPDISAPTGNADAAIIRGGFSVDILRIQLFRGDQRLFDWNFLYATPEGWGQTQSGIGRAGVEVIPHHGRIELQIEQAEPGEPWGGWGGSPVVGTEVDRFGNLLDFVGHEDDVLKVDYRAEGLEYFDIMPIWFRDHPYIDPDCDVDIVVAGDCPWFSQSFHGGIGIGDGQWRTLEVPIGISGDWNSQGVHPFWDDEETWAGESIQFLGFRFKSKKMQPTPQYSQYYNSGSGGTSGASPVLGGAYALAMENHSRLYSNVDLDQRLLRSVYYAAPSPTLVAGMPLNSTWKALFIHTADDMIRLTATNPHTPPNPDTNKPSVYHAGPDYTTGYGLVDIQSAVDLMSRNAADTPIYDMIEFEIREDDWHTYDLPVSDFFAAGNDGLKVTLVWDDSPSSNILVNNLSLVLQAPDGSKFYPWSLKVPELPVTFEGIVAAQRDQPNDRDNVEQVLIDDVDKTHGGTWKIHVSDSGMGDPMFVQKYSLVVSPWNVKGQCHACD